MRSFTFISALAGVSLVLTKPAPAPLAAPLITAAPNMVKPVLERREAGLTQECLNEAASLTASAPKVRLTEPLATWLQSQENNVQTASAWDTDAFCSAAYPVTVNAPGPVSSAYVSYTSAYASWASKAKPAIISLAQSCGMEMSVELELLLITDAGSCSSIYGEVVAVITASSVTSGFSVFSAPTATEKPVPTGSAPGPTGTAASSGKTSAAPSSSTTATQANDGAPNSSSSTAGAARETGYIAAAAAAVMAVAGAIVTL